MSINFRPKPFSISDSIEGGHWTEKYVGPLPTEAVHFLQQSNGVVKDLRVQYQRSKALGPVIEYRFSVIASFDRFTFYANKVVFDSRKKILIAEGDVLFEDGQTVRKATRVEIDLLAGTQTVSQAVLRNPTLFTSLDSRFPRQARRETR